MAKPCGVCVHPDRAEIEGRLLAGESRRGLARAFGIDRNVLDRHWWYHVPDAVREAAEARRERTRSEGGHGDGGTSRDPGPLDPLAGEVLLGHAAMTYTRAVQLLDDMQAGDIDPKTQVAALREVRAALHALADLSFRVEERGKGRQAESERPEIDDAILAALDARGVSVRQDGPDESGPEHPDVPLTERALPPAPVLPD